MERGRRAGGRREARALHPVGLKIHAIALMQGGRLAGAVAADMGLPVGLVSTWWLQRDEIQAAYEREQQRAGVGDQVEEQIQRSQQRYEQRRLERFLTANPGVERVSVGRPRQQRRVSPHDEQDEEYRTNLGGGDSEDSDCLEEGEMSRIERLKSAERAETWSCQIVAGVEDLPSPSKSNQRTKSPKKKKRKTPKSDRYREDRLIRKKEVRTLTYEVREDEDGSSTTSKILLSPVKPSPASAPTPPARPVTKSLRDKDEKNGETPVTRPAEGSTTSPGRNLRREAEWAALRAAQESWGGLPPPGEDSGGGVSPPRHIAPPPLLPAPPVPAPSQASVKQEREEPLQSILEPFHAILEAPQQSMQQYGLAPTSTRIPVYAPTPAPAPASTPVPASAGVKQEAAVAVRVKQEVRDSGVETGHKETGEYLEDGDLLSRYYSQLPGGGGTPGSDKENSLVEAPSVKLELQAEQQATRVIVKQESRDHSPALTVPATNIVPKSVPSTDPGHFSSLAQLPGYVLGPAQAASNQQRQQLVGSWDSHQMAVTATLSNSLAPAFPTLRPTPPTQPAHPAAVRVPGPAPGRGGPRPVRPSRGRGKAASQQILMRGGVRLPGRGGSPLGRGGSPVGRGGSPVGRGRPSLGREGLPAGRGGYGLPPGRGGLPPGRGGLPPGRGGLALAQPSRPQQAPAVAPAALPDRLSSIRGLSVSVSRPRPVALPSGLRLPAGISLSHPAGIQHSQQQQHSQVVDIADSPKKKVSMELSERQIAALRSLGML